MGCRPVSDAAFDSGIADIREHERKIELAVSELESAATSLEEKLCGALLPINPIRDIFGVNYGGYSETESVTYHPSYPACIYLFLRMTMAS